MQKMQQKAVVHTLQKNLLINLNLVAQTDGKSNNIQEHRNSQTFLNNTLNSLSHDFVRRSNTDKSSLVAQRSSVERYQGQSVGKKHKNPFQSQVDNAFFLEPWNSNENQLFSTNFKHSLTQIRDRNKSSKEKSLCKPFQLSGAINRKTSNYNKNRSISSVGDMRKSSYTSKNRQNNANMNTASFMTDYNPKQEMVQKNYNYSSEQKVKISLDHIVQKKKHSKMSKILRMKTHSFDKTELRQENISHQSKNLIAALERFPSDKALKKSIDHAVDVLKKRSNHSQQRNKSNISDKSPCEKSIFQQTSTKWLSCRKIDLSRETYNNSPQMKKCQFSDNKLLSKEKIGLGLQQKIANKQKCKITFKPKRNFLVESKKFRNQYKTRMNEGKQLREGNLVIVDKRFSIEQFLKVHHLTF